MRKEQFFYPETQPLFKKLEELSRRSGVSRGQAFEDWLTAIVCALAAETKEAEYLAMVERHKAGKRGKRGMDLMGEMLGALVDAMEKHDADVLGDLFEGSITYGEGGQYFTPTSIAQLMAQLSVDPDARPEGDRPLLINDPCCGTGRMLLEASKVNPHAELVGQDIDARCAKITAINLGLRGRYGWVVCGNSLSCETKFAYRIGSFFNQSPNGLRRGVIRDVPVEETPVAMLAQNAGRGARSLLDQADAAPAAAHDVVPTIVEVPRWLARLEPQLAALQRGAALEGEPRPEPPQEILSRRDEPPTQKTLF